MVKIDNIFAEEMKKIENIYSYKIKEKNKKKFSDEKKDLNKKREEIERKIEEKNTTPNWYKLGQKLK